MRPPLTGLLLSLAMFVTAFAAPARAASIPAPRPPMLAQPGAEYGTRLPRLPAEAREVELFLAPDDGSGRIVRLTVEHDARDGVLRWRMPAIAASRARLILRAGEDGREWESAPSATFAVLAPGPDELARLLAGDSESGWRLQRSLPGAAGLSLPASATTIGWAARHAHAAEESRAPGIELPVSLATHVPFRVSPVRNAPARRIATNTPAFVPLLI